MADFSQNMAQALQQRGDVRVDFALMCSMIDQGAKVLDVGCNDGGLLEFLRQEKAVIGRGMELSQKGVNASVAKGLAVIQGDADTDLVHYPDDAFDYVILSQTIQATRAPKAVLEEMLRIGQRAVISFPNFGHWRVRVQLGLLGHMPVNKSLPYSWYDTPNIHFCTIRDFIALCDEVGAKVESAYAINGSGQKMSLNMPRWVWNSFAQQAIFLLSRR
jgi:methionine biosynthesis protein MetW